MLKGTGPAHLGGARNLYQVGQARFWCDSMYLIGMLFAVDYGSNAWLNGETTDSILIH